MQCIKCKSSETRVVESRDASDNQAIRRRRECLKKSCHQRFTTYERIERSPLTVVKNDGTRERFNRDKLLDGLLKSTEKTKVSADDVEEALQRIEEYLYSQGTREVSSRYIGNQVMKELEGLDPVAYVRFASVYKEFKDIKQFDAALQRIKKKSQKKA